MSLRSVDLRYDSTPRGNRRADNDAWEREMAYQSCAAINIQLHEKILVYTYRMSSSHSKVVVCRGTAVVQQCTMHLTWGMLGIAFSSTAIAGGICSNQSAMDFSLGYDYAPTDPISPLTFCVES